MEWFLQKAIESGANTELIEAINLQADMIHRQGLEILALDILLFLSYAFIIFNLIKVSRLEKRLKIVETSNFNKTRII